MTLLNENLHPCLAFRNLYIEPRNLINMFLKFCIDMVFCFLMGVQVNNNYYYRFVFDKQQFGKSKEYFALRKMQVPFSMPIGNAEFMQVRVFSRTLVHGNSTIEIRQRNRARMQADRVEMEISKAVTKEKKSRWPNCLSGLPYPVVTTFRSSE